jgi:hypothetical protein
LEDLDNNFLLRNTTYQRVKNSEKRLRPRHLC